MISEGKIFYRSSLFCKTNFSFLKRVIVQGLKQYFLRTANGIFTLCQGFLNFYNKISLVTFSLKAGTHLLLDSVHLVDSDEGGWCNTSLSGVGVFEKASFLPRRDETRCLGV